jgi:uncharacterized membrane protein HdeD (DUF308 family)
MPATPLLSEFLSRAWWILLLRGVIAIAFGIAALAWPGVTVVTFVTIFVTFVLVDGVFDVIHAIRFRKDLEHWGLELIAGLTGVLVGVLALMAPVATSMVGGVIVALYIAAWAVVTGVLRISQAIRLRKEIDGEWLLGLSGALSVLMGIWIMANPAAGVLAMVTIIGVFALLIGFALLVLAFKVRKLGKNVGTLAAAT